MRRKKTSYDYGACHICGEWMEERRVTQEFWIKNKLILVEHVPAGVCPQCGERIVRAEVGRSIAILLEDAKRQREARMMSVPVLRFAESVASQP